MAHAASKTKSGAHKASKSGRIPDFYTIKPDGAVTLDLQKAAHSESFMAGIRRLRSHDLMRCKD